MCKKCNKNVKRLTKDHIVPKSFRKVTNYVQVHFDFDHESNIEMMCQKCNSSKSSIMDKRALPIIRKVFEKAKVLNKKIPIDLLIKFKYRK